MSTPELTPDAKRRVLMRLGATYADFTVCGLEPPSGDEREQIRAEGWTGPVSAAVCPPDVDAVAAAIRVMDLSLWRSDSPVYYRHLARAAIEAVTRR